MCTLVWQVTIYDLMRKSSKKHKSIFTIACIKGAITGCNKNAIKVTESKLDGRNEVAEWMEENRTLDENARGGLKRGADTGCRTRVYKSWESNRLPHL